jgi:FKBP-type peptidyl-prolyl cis-trans isomerase
MMTTLSMPVPSILYLMSSDRFPFLASRFEEIDDKVEGKGASASLKRPRDSDAMDTESLSKSAQKKLNKKLKAEGGKAIATGSGDEEKKSKKEKKDKVKHKKDEKEEAKNGIEGGEKAKKGDAKVLEGGIKVVDAKPGTGVQAKKGNTVSMRYIGKLASGKVFDQNVKGKPVGPLSCLLVVTTNLLFRTIFFSSPSAWAEVKLSKVCHYVWCSLRVVGTQAKHYDRVGYWSRRNASWWRATLNNSRCYGIWQQGKWRHSSQLNSYLW